MYGSQNIYLSLSDKRLMFKRLYDKIKIGKAEGGFRILHKRKTIILHAVTKKELIAEIAFAWRFKVKGSVSTEGRAVTKEMHREVSLKATKQVWLGESE